METATQTYYTELRSSLDRIKKLDALLEFFACFSRFEFTLKKNRCVKKIYGDGAGPDWKRFNSENKDFYDAQLDDLNKNDPILGAVEFLLNEPPRLQVMVDENTVEFTEMGVDEISKTVCLSFYIRRVRNNLFHGGKPMHKYGGTERDWRLIHASMTVISFWIESNDIFRETFLYGEL